MKKLLSLMLLCTVCLVFTTCGDDDNGGDDGKKKPEKFVWGGDWNDPDDPNYKPEYEGKYNPIQGLWRSDTDEEIGLYYTEDFKHYRVIFYPSGYNKDLYKDHYQINDKAYRYSPSTPDTWRYKLDGNKLILYPFLNDDDDSLEYTRVEE